MAKTYVIDTNVLIQAPYALQCFEENRLVLPLVVLEELDGLKKADGERGANARRAIRFLEKLRLQGDLLGGVALPTGGTLRVEANCSDVELPAALPDDKADNRILKVCQGLKEEGPILVTKDLVLRLKAQILGIEAEDFSTEQVIPEEDQYTGRLQCYVPEDKFKDFKKKGVPTKDVYLSDAEGNTSRPDLTENQFVILKADQSLRKTHLGRVKGKKIVPLEYKKSQPYGVKPRNSGQYFLQEALMKPADEAPLVIVKGQAGTAKTFYALAVGLEKIVNRPTGEYRRILVCRPNAQFDSDIGFLPGDEQEKISPLMRPIIDNLEQLIDASEEERYENQNRRALRPPRHPDGGPQFHPRPLLRQDLPHHRRGPEHDAQPGQEHHHPGRQGDEDHPAGRPEPDRQALFGRADQRPELRLGKDEGQPPVLSDHHDGRRMRALRTGLRRRSAPVNIRKG